MFEVSREEEEEEWGSGMWQTRSNISVCTGLPFAYLTARVEILNTVYSSNPQELKKQFVIHFLMMILA
jgi:hypothetical protein